jgi:hypothetical protein
MQAIPMVAADKARTNVFFFMIVSPFVWFNRRTLPMKVYPLWIFCKNNPKGSDAKGFYPAALYPACFLLGSRAPKLNVFSMCSMRIESGLLRKQELSFSVAKNQAI